MGTAKKHRALVFSLREWPLATGLLRVWPVPDSVLEIGCYVAGGGSAGDLPDLTPPSPAVQKNIYAVVTLLATEAFETRSWRLGDSGSCGFQFGTSPDVVAKTLVGKGFEVFRLPPGQALEDAKDATRRWAKQGRVDANGYHVLGRLAAEPQALLNDLGQEAKRNRPLNHSLRMYVGNLVWGGA